MNKKVGLLSFYIGFVGVTGFALILWATPFGAGVSPDSCIYIGAAKSLISGNGFSVDGNPMTHFPPFYPLLLAATSLLENNLVQAARFLNALLFGANIGLFALAVYLSAGRNFLTTTCAVFFVLTSAPLLVLHSMAWSEPLFISFSLACIILLSIYVKRPTSFLLIASSLSVGFAIATRYIGVAFLPAVLVIVFLGRAVQHKLGRRIRDLLICLLLSCAPIGIWFVRNIMTEGSAANRSFIFHPVSVAHYVKEVFATLLVFLAPRSLPIVVKLAFLALLSAFLIAQLIITYKCYFKNINWRSIGVAMPISCLLFSLSYLLFLFISISCFDAATPVDTRLLSPIFLILTVGIFSAMWTLSHTIKNPIILLCFLVFVALSISIKTPEAIRSVVAIQKNGLGYTSRQWRESESMAFVRMLAEDMRIYSNGKDVLGFLTEKKSFCIPEKMSWGTMIINTRYHEEIDAMCKDVKEKKALLVYFNLVNWRWNLPNQEEVASKCQLTILRSFGDGTVYGEKN